MKTVLALETSTAHASVAVCSGDKVLAVESSTSQRTHSEFINPAIERCLQQAGIALQDVDIFSAGSGPGSFTGLRVAGSIAKTFAMTFRKPLVTLDSLRLLMEEARRRGAKEQKILCLINAHKNMNYTALFRGTELEVQPCALTISELNRMDMNSVGPVSVVGEGFRAYEKLFSQSFKQQTVRNESYSDFPLATTLGLLSEALFDKGQTIEWNSFEPLYIRASEAEENLRSKSR